MTNKQKRNATADKVKSREGENQYTQGGKRDNCGSGWSDCSSIWHWAYKLVQFLIGTYTGAQIEKGEWVTEGGAYPDEKLLLPGDLLFFRAYKPNDRPRNVGHVEGYVGNGQISGHGSGIGPTRKNMIDYCKQRNAGGGKYIGVKRYIKKDASDGVTPAPKPTPVTPALAVANVKGYQRWLNMYYEEIIKRILGVLLADDGKYGKLTRFGGLTVWKDLLNRKHKAGLTPGNSNFGASCKAAAAKHAVIKKGDNGTLVAIAQGLLAAAGCYHGGIDTDFGEMLEVATKAFQKARKLKETGKVDAETWFKLFNL